MSDIMRSLPFTELMNRVFCEYRNHGSVFGIKKEYFYKPGKKKISVFGQDCSSPVGPAAGPHTQLAQNIISSYLAGGRFIELKTVQIMDYLGEKKMISKPCIDARDEGFNVEWSTEFTLDKAYDEYLKAWFVIIVLQTLINGVFDTPDFIFNMSVGYNLEGIKQPKMQRFIDGLINAESNPLFNEYNSQLKSLLDEEELLYGSEFEGKEALLKCLIGKIPSDICHGVTISTMHGCPPEEIESICSYMLREKHLNTFVKLNPTLLGYDIVRTILDSTGYNHIEITHESFDHDLQLNDAFSMLHRLFDLAESLNLGFGVKLTNTLANVNNEKVFEGKERYMSGRALLPISSSVAAAISEEFKGKLPISYSGGANLYSVLPLFECGIRPITLATDMLKPGGYSRLNEIAHLVERSDKWNLKCVDTAKIKDYSEKCIKEDYVKRSHRLPFSAKVNDKLPLFDCFVSPCQKACPIEQSIPDYIKLVADGNYSEALSLIYQDNPLPGMTCNICDHQCQYHCSRMDYEGSVDIRKIKKIAFEKGFDQFFSGYNRPSLVNGKKIAVVGAGPSGLSVAYFLARAGLSVRVFEKESKAGGVVANVIPEFRIDSEAIDNDIKFIQSLGVEFEFNVKEESVSVSSLKKDGFDYIIYAIGTSKGNKVVLKGDSSCVIDGLEFLKSYKSGKTNLGKNVVVEGAGNSAMDCARAAKRLNGVDKVTVVYRRSIKEMPASYEEYLEAVEEGIDFAFLCNPYSLDNDKLLCNKMVLGEPDESGRRKPVESGETVEFECNNLILAIGEHVDYDMVSSLGLPTDDSCHPVVNDKYETKISGVYAIGDMSTGPSTVVRCIKTARIAADAILSSLNIPDILDEPVEDENISDEEFFEEEDKFFESIERKKNHQLLNREKLVNDYKKFAKQEESRCMNCSFLCSKCVDVCPNRANVAIDMKFSENSIDAYQIIHLDAYCNECGNCATFCNHNGKPYRDKFTLFSSKEDFENSNNQGFYSEGDCVVVRINDSVVQCRFNKNGVLEGKVPDLVKDVIEEIFISYSYLLGRVDL